MHSLCCLLSSELLSLSSISLCFLLGPFVRSAPLLKGSQQFSLMLHAVILPKTEISSRSPRFGVVFVFHLRAVDGNCLEINDHKLVSLFILLRTTAKASAEDNKSKETNNCLPHFVSFSSTWRTINDFSF